MSDIAIKVEGLGKRYRIGARQDKHKTLREKLNDVALSPFRAVKSFASRNGHSDSQFATRPSKSDTIWALKDVSFELKRGDLMGVIGHNGAGKSTLLKILSRITEPTEGYADIHGRVGSLLEVGTGFHPELTGRENIYLNGAIIGMRRKEIERKFDEIVGFSEVEKFINTPVKHYSSGMYLRLAFAVAAHLEPEILIIDEVLAVGDAAFQKKCLGKMEDVARGGRTVLFVSHNLGAIGRLCNQGMLLDKGRIVSSGRVSDVIRQYTESVMCSTAESYFEADLDKKIQIRTVQLLNQQGKPSTELDREHPFRVFIEYEVRQHVSGAHVGVMLDKLDGTAICHSADIDVAPSGIIEREPGLYQAVVEFPGGLLNAGAYQIRIGIGKRGGEKYDYCDAFVFHLNDHGSFATLGFGGRQRLGLLALPLEWKIEKVA